MFENPVWTLEIHGHSDKIFWHSHAMDMCGWAYGLVGSSGSAEIVILGCAISACDWNALVCDRPPLGIEK